MNRTVACIMAGGVGSRFWPASQSSRPKQFMDIMGTGRSLIQSTYERYRNMGLSAHDIFVITNREYVDQVQSHLPDLPPSQIVGEPQRKNTAPAAYLANKIILETIGTAIVIMAPSDHLIGDEDTFHKVVQKGQEYLQHESAILTIGIQPDFPHTGYGYIHFQQDGQPPFHVKNFTEKPDHKTAAEFLETNEYLWNAGIFMWRTDTMDEAFQLHAPEIKSTMDAHLIFEKKVLNQKSLEKAFDAVEDLSIDYAIMERAKNVYTIPASFDWSDLGSWHSLHEKSEKDSNNNAVVTENALIEQSTNNLIYAPGKRVVVFGLEDMMIVDDNGTLVICPISKNQDVKRWRNHFDS